MGTDGDGVYRSTKTYGAWVMDVPSAQRSADDVSIFPNPAATKIKVGFTSTPQTYTVTISDLLGRSILSVKNTDIINVSTVRPGKYFARIATPEHTVTLPLVITR